MGDRMSLLSDKILSYIADGERPTQSELANALGESFESVRRELDVLEAAGEIVITKKGKIMPQSDSGLIRGTFSAAQRGFGFVMPADGSRDIFVSSDNCGGAINGDTVLAVVTNPSGRGGAPEGRIVQISERSVKSVIGTMRELESRGKRGSPRFYVEPDDKRLSFNILVETSTMPTDIIAGDKVEVELTRYPDSANGIAAYGNVTDVFGESDSVEANYAAILSDNGIITSFSPEALDFADEVAAMPLDAAGRLDLRGKTVFTIDPEGAKDLDDAISVEKNDDGTYTLGVHIADVSNYVTEGSILDREAFERGTSVYFVDQVVPMLPEVISNGSCSLNSGAERFTLSAVITLSETGEILNTELHESLISSVVQGVYSEVNDLLENGSGSNFADKYKALGNSLDIALELYRILDTRSAERGALELETVESKIILDDDGYVADIVKVERGIAERLIEQFMLCANEAVATWLYWQHMPCVYRVHDDPDPEKIKTFTIFAHNLGLDITPLRTRTLHPAALRAVMLEAEEKGYKTIASYVLLRSLAKARYDAVCSPHFGLAIERYCHFTSPIRRYPDLSVHRIIKSIIRGKADIERITELESFATSSAHQSSDCEIRAIHAERDIEALFKALFMADHIGEIFEGTISSVQGFGFFVDLDNTCSGLVHISTLDGYFDYNENTMSLHCGRRSFALGQRVKVIIDAADIVTRKVSMKLVEDDV